MGGRPCRMGQSVSYDPMQGKSICSMLVDPFTRHRRFTTHRPVGHTSDACLDRQTGGLLMCPLGTRINTYDCTCENVSSSIQEIYPTPLTHPGLQQPGSFKCDPEDYPNCYGPDLRLTPGQMLFV
jgi:hypothetical protein